MADDDGDKASTRELRVRRPPQAPGVPACYRKTHDSITLQWVPSRNSYGSAIKEYTIEGREGKSGPWTISVISEHRVDESELLLPGNYSQYEVLTDLKPSTKYQFRIKATNAVGYGEYSGTSDSISTKPLPKPRAKSKGSGSKRKKKAAVSDDDDEDDNDSAEQDDVGEYVPTPTKGSKAKAPRWPRGGGRRLGDDAPAQTSTQPGPPPEAAPISPAAPLQTPSPAKSGSKSAAMKKGAPPRRLGTGTAGSRTGPYDKKKFPGAGQRLGD